MAYGDSILELSVYSVFGLVFGLISFFKSFGWQKQKRLIENTPTSKIRSLAMGLVEIYGEVVAGKKKLLYSPISYRPCVYYKYSVEEERGSGKSRRWVKIMDDEKSSHFFLYDGTGFVLVDLNGAKIDIPSDYSEKTGLGKSPSNEIIKFLKENNLSHKGFLGFNKAMKFTEYYIAPKDKLYILGTAGDNPFVEEGMGTKNEADIMIQKGSNKLYYVSDKHEKGVLKNLKWKANLGMYGGGALAVACLAYIVWFLGFFR